MDAAFAHGLEVTALHNHFFFDQPKVYFMHIGGQAEPQKLAAAVKAVWDAIREVRAENAQPAEGFGGDRPGSDPLTLTIRADADMLRNPALAEQVAWALDAAEIGPERLSLAIPEPLSGADEWPLRVVIAVTDRARKAVGSTEGMQRTAETSPFYRAWVDNQPRDLAICRDAISRRDFEALADVSEASALAMHGLAMSARPGLLYFNATTTECIHRIRRLRDQGTAVFFTVDAGPQVKAICLPGHDDAVAEALSDVPGVRDLLRSDPGPGAYCVDGSED